LSPTFFGFVDGQEAVLKPEKSASIENGGLKGRLQARLPAAQNAKACRRPSRRPV
jgi:hypothetical protein